MLNFFEKLTDAFPAKQPVTPPYPLLSFIYHYSRDMRWPLLALTVLTALIAILEVKLFAFLGQLVDWLSDKDPGTLLTDESATLWNMGIVLLVALPILSLLHTCLLYTSDAADE